MGGFRLHGRSRPVRGRPSRSRTALLFLAVVSVSIGLYSLLAPAAASQAQKSFTITVSLGADTGVVKVPVNVSGSSVSGATSWNAGSTEHDTSVSGTIEKGLDGNDRIIVDVKDSWYRPGDSAVEGDSGW